MAGMVPKYTEQLVALVDKDTRTAIERLERVMKGNGAAVSRADVIRQALDKGLPALLRRYKSELDALDAATKSTPVG